MKFSNTYVQLGDAFFERISPTPVSDPKVFLWNDVLADRLEIPPVLVKDTAALAQVFAGNRMIEGSEPIALAYAGHQFGHFSPQLGDGRAHLLGEILDKSGARFDIQLKGSGPTKFSRRGDGRCALGPAVREFLMSEAMAALGVPTTRCLAVVTTGEPVFRGTSLPGAVVTRIATSHIRVGTFEYFSGRGDLESLEQMVDYAIQRHYPEIEATGPDRIYLLLNKVMERQINLIVDWMRIGFIHGVMNTDNTAISGETIDFGPCAMMGIYDPATVYSSIDANGRYAFGNQPPIAQWNVGRFASSLLPLFADRQEEAVKSMTLIIAEFHAKFQTAWSVMMGKKLGLVEIQDSDHDLFTDLLFRLQGNQLDYTLAFNQLTASLETGEISESFASALGQWLERWRQRLSEQKIELSESLKLMASQNPIIIPRNHYIEQVIDDCVLTGRADSALKYLEVLRSPYRAIERTKAYQAPASDGDQGYQTFCGT